ncbi:NAD dependent epimerase/dehydratase family protein [Olsenella sp. DNF00959]|nr:NAD dependent epimerase/dehydratase family protein [Olsenella sp. DNF00959]
MGQQDEADAGEARAKRKDIIMKIAVIAANGKAGQLIVKEAVTRGHDVTAVVRGENKTVTQSTLAKDLFDLNAEDLAGFDAVIDAFGAWAPEVLPQHSTSLAHLCDALSGTGVRLLVVGGAGSLFVDADHTTTLNQTPDFPADFQPLAAAMQKALDELRQRDDVRWTYLSPAADFQAGGEKTGTYQLGGEELMVGSQGPVISYADYAIAMVDLAESGEHVGERVSVVHP